MSALSPELREFLDEQIVGVLATRSAAGRVHQSLVYYALDGDDVVISTEGGRLKALDVEATGWASLCVMGHARPFPSLTVVGPATLRRTDIGPATASVMQRILGADEPPDPQSDVALAEVDRVILALEISQVGPVSYIGSS